METATCLTETSTGPASPDTGSAGLVMTQDEIDGYSPIQSGYEAIGLESLDGQTETGSIEGPLADGQPATVHIRARKFGGVDIYVTTADEIGGHEMRDGVSSHAVRLPSGAVVEVGTRMHAESSDIGHGLDDILDSGHGVGYMGYYWPAPAAHRCQTLADVPAPAPKRKTARKAKRMPLCRECSEPMTGQVCGECGGRAE